MKEKAKVAGEMRALGKGVRMPVGVSGPGSDLEEWQSKCNQ